MMWVVVLVGFLHGAHSIDFNVSSSFACTPETVEQECEACWPEYPPAVLTQGNELVLQCWGGRFLLYPELDQLRARCESPHYRVTHDQQLRHLSELGCQENIFEDVLHEVEECAPPLQGRAYLAPPPGPLHIAVLCHRPQAGLPLRSHLATAPDSPPLAPHTHARSPLSLLGNFNHMFDSRTRHAADLLFADPHRLNRRLRELVAREDIALGGHELTAAALLPHAYFPQRLKRVADFSSNKIPVWRAVAQGNLAHVQRDVAALLRKARARRLRTVHVHAGVGGVASVHVEGGRSALWLWPGRFPVPQLVWTVVYETMTRRATAVLVLNDPLVEGNELSGWACAGSCSRMHWARSLVRQNHAEVATLGLTRCCSVHELAAALRSANVMKAGEEITGIVPQTLLSAVPVGEDGLLVELPNE